MKLENLETSIEEAKRFLEKCELLKKRLEIDKRCLYGCKESGAVKRSSLDLTRSLAELRR